MGSRHYGFACFPYSVISMACLRAGSECEVAEIPCRLRRSTQHLLTEIRQDSKETRYGTAEEAAEKAPVRCMSERPAAPSGEPDRRFQHPLKPFRGVKAHISDGDVRRPATDTYWVSRDGRVDAAGDVAEDGGGPSL